jgi:hypothetical protein
MVAGLVLAETAGCLNPTFVNQLSNGAVVPLAPGDTPFVHVLVINATQSLTLGFQFGWTPDFQGFNTGFVFGVAPEQQKGFLLGCPVDQIGLGNPGDLNAPAIVITTSADEVINVPPAAFPLVLSRPRDFECGDTVVFTVIDDPNNGYGIQVLPGRVDGRNYTGPFSGPDTFEIVQLMLMSAGTPPIPIP